MTRQHDESWGPICPVCNCPYAEHTPGCTVTDGFNDSLEGPWDTREDAETFTHAEVGAEWLIVAGRDGKFYVMVKSE